MVNLSDKKEYNTNIRNLKQALNHGLVLKKTHKFINSNQKAGLKWYKKKKKGKEKSKNWF